MPPLNGGRAMKDRFAQHRALIAMTAFAFVLSMSVAETSAQTRTIARDNNMTGTYDCSCNNNSGTCELIQQGPTLTCLKGSGTCTGGCELSTTTTGVSGSGVRRPPPPPTGGLRQ